MNIFLIAIGGAAGSVTRYLFSLFLTAGKFPLATFSVNVLGSLLAGVAYFFVVKHFDAIDPRFKNFLFVGFFGGFTTFSAFSLDFFRLFTAGNYSQAFTYAVASVVLSLLAIFFGFYLAKCLA
ncbi:MAG: fluoride efflux transporter CrcB [Alphaproteobacteria bacterium]|nr:fluoride efflux transporter CrcB [Alphaproteobacteria bacterium]